VKFLLKYMLILAIFIPGEQGHAIPIDWNGSLGFDTNIIKNVRRTSDDCSATAGSECTGNDNAHGRYQSMLLRLNPTMIVNDSTSIKGELSVGNIRGAFLGQDAEMANDGSYFSQSSDGSSSLNVNQIYAELYADTALYKVGKFSKSFGLGAILNSGEGRWDRFYSLYNGFEALFKLGNFKLTPTIAKISSPDGKPHSGKYDVNEMAITALYDNPTMNMKAGVYYAIRDAESQNELMNNSGAQEVNIIDIFVERQWEKLSLGLEIPIFSGSIGNAYGAKDGSYKATSFIVESSYKVSPKWKVGLDAGRITGSDGDDRDHEATSLHPNYQIAEIMFRYNMKGFQDSNENIFASSITNTNYYKFYSRYHNDAWAWNVAFIMAKANETARNGSKFFDHSSNSYHTAAANQSDDLGYEFDFSFDYEWNPSIFVTGYLAYYKVGSFYEFTNGNEDISAANITAMGLRLSVNF
jgi:hypothetical protein